MTIKIKRIYEPFSATDGYRVLVDRLWPRGVKKDTAHIDDWKKEIAPSTNLRKWFDHDPKKWKEFLTKYNDELKSAESFREFKATIKKHKVVTLLYGAKDEKFNQAVALKHFLEKL